MNWAKRYNWIFATTATIIGALIILCAGIIGTYTYLGRRITSSIQTTPVEAKPENEISDGNISLKPGSDPKPLSQSSQPKKSETTEIECYKDPKKALNSFLSYLHSGQYERAARLYAGDYPFEAIISPSELEPEEQVMFRARFLKNHCFGHLTCLKHEIVNEKILSEKEVLFGVQFFDKNGELFELARPLGREPKELKVYTRFGFKVMSENGCYKSMDFPPTGP